MSRLKLNPAFLVLGILLLSFTFVQAEDQSAKPVLVIFHDVEESSDDLTDAGSSALRTDQFAEVVLTDYDWKKETVPEAAARLFRELTQSLDNTRFVLYGFGKGGLIAEWIATRLKESDGRIVRVITVDTAFDGLKRPGLEMDSPGLQDIAPNSSTLHTLQSAPVNSIAKIEFIRLWERNNTVVVQDSALRKPSGGEAATSQLIVRTKPFDPHEIIPEMLAQARKDYETKQYNKVIEACRYILKAEPKHAKGNSLLGLSLFSSGQVEADVNKAAELFNESLKYLTNAIAVGEGFQFSIAHHHSFGIVPGVLFVANDLCYGKLMIDRDTVAFDSNSDSSHIFLAPINKVSAQFIASEVGTLHIEADFDRGTGKEKHKVYNFFANQVRMSTSFTQVAPGAPVGSNQATCDERCPLTSQTLTQLVNKVQQLPLQPKGPKKKIWREAVHYAVLAKNKHVGKLTFSEDGLYWEETSNNPDPKHNFSMPWASLEKVYMSTGLYIELIFKENKKSKTFQIAVNGNDTLRLVKMIYQYSGVVPG